METKPQTSKQYFTTLSIIHFALVAGQVLFMGVLLYMQSNGGTEVESGADTSFMLIATLAMAGILVGMFITRNRLASIEQGSELKDKLAQYSTTLIIKYALLEGPSLVALVFFLQSGNYYLLGISAFLIIFLIINRPTKEKALSDLPLSHKERTLIEDSNAIIAEVKVQG